MHFGVGIITDGKEPGKLATTINSVLQEKQNGAQVEEIVVAGDVPNFAHQPPDVIKMDLAKLAQEGKLGAMRNRLTDTLSHDLDAFVLLDDDMILHEGFFGGIEEYAIKQDFDILSCKIENPDGSRYWDWAVWTGNGSRLLDYGMQDERVYVTGGLCIARPFVFGVVQWNDDLGFNQKEDVDFSLRARDAGMTIKFNPYSAVTHNADYTQVGEAVLPIDKQYTAVKSDSDKKRILWYSPPPWNQTGYGIQSYQYIKALQEADYEVRLVPFGPQLKGAPNIEWEGIKILATGNHKMGLQALKTYTDAWEPDAVISLIDVWPLPEDLGLQLRMVGGKWCPITPVDHDPIPQHISDRLAFAHTPIAMSQFGYEQMINAGLEDAAYIPHAYHEDIYHPDIEPAMQDDKFLIGMVAANVGTFDRKGFQHAFEIFSRLDPERFSFYIHTDPTDTIDKVKVRDMAEEFGVDVRFPHTWQLFQGISGQTMATIFKSFDLLLMPSRAEGFGVPLIEAQAVGTPVMATDFTSMSELTLPENRIPVRDRIWTPMSSWQAFPDWKPAVEQIEYLADIKENEPIAWTDVLHGTIQNAALYNLSHVAEKYLLPVVERITANREKEPIAE